MYKFYLCREEEGEGVVRRQGSNLRQVKRPNHLATRNPIQERGQRLLLKLLSFSANYMRWAYGFCDINGGDLFFLVHKPITDG